MLYFSIFTNKFGPNSPSDHPLRSEIISAPEFGPLAPLGEKVKHDLSELCQSLIWTLKWSDVPQILLGCPSRAILATSVGVFWEKATLQR